MPRNRWIFHQLSGAYSEAEVLPRWLRDVSSELAHRRNLAPGDVPVPVPGLDSAAPPGLRPEECMAVGSVSESAVCDIAAGRCLGSFTYAKAKPKIDKNSYDHGEFIGIDG